MSSSLQHIDTPGPFSRQRFMAWMLGLTVVAVGLAWVSTSSFLLFHSLVEVSMTAMGWSLFFLAWNTRKYSRHNGYLLYLGAGFFMVGLVGLLHAMAYEGAGVFPGHGANLPTQLWIAARYLETAALLGTPLLFGRRIKGWYCLAGWSAATALLLWLIFSGRFPACWVEGSGLTVFKVVSEYAVVGVTLLAGVLFLVRRDRSRNRVMYLLLVAMACSVAAELAFTFYAGVYDEANVFGHFFKLAAFWCVYWAIVVEGLSRPLNSVFRELKQAETMRADVDRIMRHDLRAPLTAFIDFPGFILETAELSKENVHMLKLIEESGRRMLRMLDLSRDLFKMENNEYEPRPAPVDMAVLARKALEEHSALARGKKLDTPVLVDGRPAVEGDSVLALGEELLLYTALTNLVLNALEAAPLETEVRVALDREDGRVRVRVSNQGAVHPAVRKTFFNKYATHGKREGTGLGTYSARLITRTLGGDVTMDTSEERGTTVTMTLPAAVSGS